MFAEGQGRIVNMSSIIASTGYYALSIYAATKASMVGFTKSLAREVGRAGITGQCSGSRIHRDRDDGGSR